MNKSCLKAFEGLYAIRPHEGRVFQSKHGRDLNDSRAWLNRVVEDAEVSNFMWHALRNTFISRLIVAGVDLRTARGLAGHKTISMTVRCAHLAPEYFQAAIEKLEAVMKFKLVV